MKCPECAKQHRYAAGMRCPCGYQFAVDRKKYGVSDNKIVTAARRASGQGGYCYTVHQLASAMKPGELVWVCVFLGVVGVLFAALGAAVFLAGEWGGVAFVFFGVVMTGGAVFLPRVSHKADPPLPKILAAVAKYEALKGPLPKLIREPGALSERPSVAVEPDVYDYGVTAVLICEQQVLVDLLVLNGWHSENRTLVVGINGYPEYLVDRVNAVLRQQPIVPVFVVHDAWMCDDGVRKRVIADGQYEIGNHDVIDLGLAREDVKRLKIAKRFAAADGSVPLDVVSWPKLSALLSTAIGARVSLVAAGEILKTRTAGGNGDGDATGYG